jgi:hypothetical protein
MMKRMRLGQPQHAVGVNVLVALALASCGIYGDKGQGIEFVNNTGQHVVLWQQGRAHPAYRKELAADSRFRDVWVDSRLGAKARDEVKFRVEAVTDSGDVLFCHEYTWNDFSRIGWIVDIRALNDCPPE